MTSLPRKPGRSISLIGFASSEPESQEASQKLVVC
jgi:hypothetical protein